MAAHRLSVYLLAFLVAGCWSLRQPIPLIAWSNSDAFSSVRQREVSSVAGILEQAKLDNLEIVVVFKSDSLTFDNIMKYGGAYGDKNGAFRTLQSELRRAHSSVWSGVHGNPASDLLETLPEELGVQPHYLKNLEQARLYHGLDFPQLVIHDFPVADNYEEFTEQDEMIATVLHAINQLDATYAIFYTAGNSVPLQDAGNPKPRRGVGSTVVTSLGSQSSSCGYSFTARNSHGNPCLLFCLTEDLGYYYNYYNGQKRDVCVLSNATLMEETVRCSDENNAIPEFEMEFQKICQNKSEPVDEKLHIRFLFPAGSSNYSQSDYIMHGYWRMDLQIEAGPEAAPGELGDTLIRTHTDEQLYYLFVVPYGSSYSCASSNYNSYSVNGSVVNDYYTGRVVQFEGVQVQPYETIYSSGENAVFSSSSNCESFLSLPAWMGVVAMLMLLLVFYIAILIAFSIQTMDQFDDPRGQTISVENLH